MNFGQAFTFQFEDPDWAKKILIPALIALIPIVGQIFLIGWLLSITRAVIRQDPRPLPDLDFGKQFKDGFKGFVAALGYVFPAILMSIPVVIVSVMASEGNMDEDTMAVIVPLVSVCCNGLIFLYALVMAFFLPAALGNMVAKESLGAAFRFSEVLGLVKIAPGAYLLVLLGAFVTGMLAPLGMIACIIGAIFTYAYTMSVNGHLYGQAYNEATRNQGMARIF